MFIGLALVAMAVIAAICFIAYLLFCRFVVNKTGKTEGLNDVAAAMRAYKVPLPARSGKKATDDCWPPPPPSPRIGRL
jgi:hypothetical protein